MSDPVKVVKDFVAAIGAGDFDQAMAMLSPDFVLHHNTRLPYKGVYRGREGFAELIQKMGAFWESFEPGEGTQHVRDGDAVVVIGNIVGKPRHLPGSLKIHVLERYAIEDGQITRIWPFYIDTDLTEEQVHG